MLEGGRREARGRLEGGLRLVLWKEQERVKTKFPAQVSRVHSLQNRTNKNEIFGQSKI
jgi:hypothetical protein